MFGANFNIPVLRRRPGSSAGCKLQETAFQDQRILVGDEGGREQNAIFHIKNAVFDTKNGIFYAKNAGFGAKTTVFCIKNADFCMKIGDYLNKIVDFCVKIDDFCNKCPPLLEETTNFIKEVYPKNIPFRHPHHTVRR